MKTRNSSGAKRGEKGDGRATESTDKGDTEVPDSAGDTTIEELLGESKAETQDLPGYADLFGDATGIYPDGSDVLATEEPVFSFGFEDPKEKENRVPLGEVRTTTESTVAKTTPKPSVETANKSKSTSTALLNLKLKAKDEELKKVKEELRKSKEEVLKVDRLAAEVEALRKDVITEFKKITAQVSELSTQVTLSQGSLSGQFTLKLTELNETCKLQSEKSETSLAEIKKIKNLIKSDRVDKSAEGEASGGIDSYRIPKKTPKPVPVVPKIECLMCEGNHTEDKCTEFPTGEDRKLRLTELRRCWRCGAKKELQQAHSCPKDLKPCSHCHASWAKVGLAEQGLHLEYVCPRGYPHLAFRKPAQTRPAPFKGESRGAKRRAAKRARETSEHSGPRESKILSITELTDESDGSSKS